jgi:CheY-like chemotaxis protein
MKTWCHHVLYIDDDADDKEVFRDAVTQLNSHVICNFSCDGLSALQYLQENLMVMPDYIFVDVNMPIMGGLEFLKRLKKIPRLRTIPVIIYSTAPDPQDREEYFRLGANYVIKKPSTFQQLIDLLKSILEEPQNDSIAQSLQLK